MARTYGATVTIYDAGDMNKKQRKDLASWLRCHARRLVKRGKRYRRTFQGRYPYRV